MNYKKIRLVFTLFVLLSAATSHAKSLSPKLTSGHYADNYAVKIFYDTQELRKKILVTFEPLESDKSKNYIIVEVDEEEHHKLLDVDMKVEIDNTFTTLINSPPVVNKNLASREIANAAAMTSYPTINNFACYRTVEGTFATAVDIVNNYPSLASWSDQGDSWEKDVGIGGFDMNVLKITNSAISGSKPALFMTSSIHAREYAPAELATRFAEHLVMNYGIDADITWMLDHHEVHMMLQANPDGRKQAETGLSWRKNSNENYCGVTSNTRGADLNRNFAYQWDCCNGSSSNECSLTFHGAGPASEPETQAIQSYMSGLFGDNRGPGLNDPAPLNTQGVYLDIHSYSELVLWPWGFTNNVPPNNMQTLGRKLAYSNGYTPEQAIGLYPTDGTTDDYAYGELGVASYTFELGTSFFQDCSTFENTIVPTNFPSLLYALKAAKAPYQLPLGPEVINIDLDQGDSSAVPAGTLVSLSATASDNRFNNSNGTESSQNVVEAEFFIDTAPWEAGAVSISMTANDGSFNSANEAIVASIDTTNLSDGKHTVYVQAKDADNNWGVVTAIFLNIDSNAVLPTVIFEDNFETDLGWSANPSNTDTATTGQWERANPQDTNSSGPKQLGTTVSGTFDLVTGATAGSSVGVNDIDNGVTSIRSPDITIPNGGPYTLSLSYYLSHTSNSSTADFLRVTVVGNSNSVIFEELGAANDDDGTWDHFNGSLDAFAGQTIHLLIEAADAGNGSIVEAGIDDIKIEGIVTGGNQAPVISVPPNQSNNEGEIVSLFASATDGDGDSITFSATGLPSGIGINSATGEMSGTLATASAGSYSVTVTVSDGTTSDSGTFTWIVTEVNVAPVLTNPGNQATNEGNNVSLQLSASDVNNDILTFSATGLPADLSINSVGLITGNLSMTSSGTYNVSATVNDGLLSDNVSFVWTVNNVNQAPVVTSPGNQSGLVGDGVSLSISASDSDDDALIYSATGLPAGTTIDTSTGVISGSLTNIGSSSVTVSVSDGTDTDSVSFIWTVALANIAPVITNPSNQINDEGASVSLQVSATDANNDSLNYSATGLPNDLSINSTTGLISGNLSMSSSGAYSVTVTVNDGSLSDTASFTWSINNVNQAPTINGLVNLSNDEGDNVSVNPVASDPDGDSLTFSAAGLPAGISIDVNSGAISGSLSLGSNGDYTVTVNTTDGSLSDSTTFQWTISEVVISSDWLETLLINGVSSNGWTTVNLSHNYNSLVAVCTVNYLNNNIPEVVRMKNVTTTSFDIRLQNPSNTTLNAETVHCIAMEEGSWELSDGRQIEAQKFNSTITDNRNSWLGQSASYLGSYTTPVVIGQVMTYNDVDWSVFWSRGSSRTSPATASSLFVGKTIAEDSDTTRSNETLGFIVMEAGNGSADSIPYEAKRGADTVRGLNNGAVSYSYSQTFNGIPQVGVASQTAMDGNNGGWSVLRGNNPLAGGGITLAIDEDQIRDNERSHTTEQVMFMVFESEGQIALTVSP